MPGHEWISQETWAWVVLPLLIFLARICDVSIGTLRTVFVARGRKFLAPVLGFFEVLIWIVAIGTIMKNLNNWACFFAYALGFAAGNYVGLVIEERLALGSVIIRIMTQASAEELVESLKANRFGVTTYAAQGVTGRTQVIFSVVRRRDLGMVKELVRQHNPKAFYTVEDVRTINEGVFPSGPGSHG